MPFILNDSSSAYTFLLLLSRCILALVASCERKIIFLMILLGAPEKIVLL